MVGKSFADMNGCFWPTWSFAEFWREKVSW